MGFSPSVSSSDQREVLPEIKKEERKIAYFSMEIGIDNRIPTYSGGLGVLAADTIKSCADLNVPLIAVTLLYKKGYFYQQLDAQGNQKELPYSWNPEEFLRLLPEKINVTIEERVVVLQAWVYIVKGINGYAIPVFFLDADTEQNNEFDRSLSYYLYGGEQRYRLAQEVILGIGGLRMIKKIGFDRISRCHMNEGHSSLLTLELLKERKKNPDSQWDIDGVKRMCVFTTHTPVPAGMDQFSYDLVARVLGEFIDLSFLKSVAGEEKLNMTLLALNLSHYENGVAKEHGIVSREMFPGYHIDSITNGVHSSSWVCDSFGKLYDTYVRGWKNDPFSLRYALNIPKDEIWAAHVQAKKSVLALVQEQTGVTMDEDVLTIGFARRATAYKRAHLVFSDIERLLTVSRNKGKLQFVFAGKAHPHDQQGKELIKSIVSLATQLKERIKIVYLENYDIQLAKALVSGVDLWLNTPQKPKEASGTSGMKAAHNGVPSFSILDGWWIEGCIEELTGWAIGSVLDVENDDRRDAESLYDKLENSIMTMYYEKRDKWIDIMRHSIAINASFFNTHRMVQQYVLKAYF